MMYHSCPANSTVSPMAVPAAYAVVPIFGASPASRHRHSRAAQSRLAGRPALPPLRSVCVFMWLPPFSSAFGPRLLRRPGQGPCGAESGRPVLACPPGRRTPRRPPHGPCPKRPGRPNAKARRTHGTPVGAARPLQWREQAETTRKKERHACPACLLHDGGGAPFVKPVCAVFHSVPRFCGKTRCFLLLYTRTAGVSITRFAPQNG